MFRSSATVLLVLALASCEPVNNHPATEFTSSALGATSAPATSKTCHAVHYVESDPQAWLPDPQCTPGEIDPTVTVDMLCPKVSPALKRPPTGYTNSLKSQQLLYEYDYVDSQGPHQFTPYNTEEDHLVARSLGGQLASKRNLWPEPHQSWNEKDSVEAGALAAVCQHRITLADAQQGMMTNWYELGKRLGIKMSSSAQLSTDGK